VTKKSTMEAQQEIEKIEHLNQRLKNKTDFHRREPSQNQETQNRNKKISGN
jgi:hypothetical protein